jgi:hypothetical protein
MAVMAADPRSPGLGHADAHGGLAFGHCPRLARPGTPVPAADAGRRGGAPPHDR